MLDLKKKDLIVSKPGPGGTNLNCDLSKLTLYDVYELVAEPSDNLLKFTIFLILQLPSINKLKNPQM